MAAAVAGVAAASGNTYNGRHQAFTVCFYCCYLFGLFSLFVVIVAH